MLKVIYAIVTLLAVDSWAAHRPNIVFIIADDLGYGDVQCLNPERGKIKTPHLDKLASQGMTFTDAHSGSSVCTPTRYGLLTGRYAWRTRLQRGVLDGGDDVPLIAPDRLTVAGLLKEHGYATACLGKWHLGFQSELPAGRGETRKQAGRSALPVGAKIIGGPTTRGFDLFFGCSNARTISALIENDRVTESIQPIQMLPRLGKRAVEYIREQTGSEKNGKPFFLYLPLTSPHTPIVPAGEWRGKSGLGAYADFVMQTDAVVGGVLDALEAGAVAENTLIFFTSDNGCSPAADVNELEAQGHFPSAQFRGYKADIWDGGHRVPFLVRWPGKVKAGSRSSQLVCLTDFVATCSEMLGTKLPDNAGEDSVSLLPALLGKDNAPLREAIVHHSINGRFAIRRGPWKLALCAGSGGWGRPGDAEAAKQGLPAVQLYDLRADVAESKNVQGDQRDIARDLADLLERYIVLGRSTPGKPQTNDVRVVLTRK